MELAAVSLNIRFKENTMNEEEKRVDSQEQGDSRKSSDIDYVAAIKELKENSVPKEEYDRVLARERELLDAYLNGSKKAEEEDNKPQEKSESVEELREELFSGKKKHTDLEYVTKAMKLRKQLIDRGEMDPFLPVTISGLPTADDVFKAEQCAQVYQECIDIADGDPEVFKREFARRVVDINLPNKKR